MFVRRLLSVATLAIGISVYGTEPDSVSIVEAINTSGTVSVTQPEALTALLTRAASAHTAVVSAGAEHQRTAPVARTGYRVQVFDDNNPRAARRNAEGYHARMETQFPQYRSYLTFNSPYWRVRVGDFHTRAEAEAAMAEIRQAFPALGAYLRVIRDKINVTD